MTARILMLAATAAMLLPGNALADTLTIRLNADIRGTDGLNRDANTDVVLHHVFETLVAFRNDLSIGPLLAESWDVANDGTQYRFSLREGAVFHSGAPVTAEDVVWNWERRMDADSGWFCQPFFDGRQGLEVTDVRAEDPRTVVFDLAAPNALFLAQLANVQCNGWIASPENVDQDGVWREGVAIGSGSFALAEWDRGQSITLTRFADYQPLSEPRSGLSGDRSVLVEHLRFLIVPDTSTADFDRAVAEEIAGALLLRPSFYEIEVPPGGLQDEEFWNLMFIRLTESCSAMMGGILSPSTQLEDWLTITQPYLSAPYLALTADDSLAALSDLEPRGLLGTPFESTADLVVLNYLQTVPTDQRWRRLPYEDVGLMLDHLEQGVLTAGIVWQPMLVARRPDGLEASGLRAISSAPLQSPRRELGILLRSDDTALRTSIDQAISALRDDGTLETLAQDFGLEYQR